MIASQRSEHRHSEHRHSEHRHSEHDELSEVDRAFGLYEMIKDDQSFRE